MKGFNSYSCRTYLNVRRGVVVAELIKASVAIHIIVGSNPDHGRHRFLGSSRFLEREAAAPQPGHGRKSTGAH